jgi:amino acid transporter
LFPPQLYVSIDPIDATVTAESFFNSYLALPVVMFLWFCGFLWKRKGWLRTDQIDLDTGRRELPWDDINAYRARLAAMPAWKRIFHTLFI